MQPLQKAGIDVSTTNNETVSPLRVLISGAGIAGPALALHLSRLPAPLKCIITIVERHPDLRGQGIAAMRALGLEEQVRAIVVNEPGLRIVDRRRGALRAYFASNKSGKGAQGFSAEWELMRGDLYGVLYEATKGLEGVRYVFGTTVERLEHVREGTAARVWLSDGTEGEYDLVVGCDGVGSREGDTPDAEWCHLGGRRFFLTRRDRPDCLRVFLGYAGADEEFVKAAKHGTIPEQKQAWVNAFKHDLLDSFKVSRLLKGLDSPEADDFYSHQFAQIKLDNWSEGRIAVLGDSASCPAPLTGQGTSLALCGAYVLAGEIARACSKAAEKEDANPWDSIPAALKAYEATLRPLVHSIQGDSVKGTVNLMCPDSGWFIDPPQLACSLYTKLRLDWLVARFQSDNTGKWKLPEYPELAKPKA
ncbi:hypothetical protein F5144DRAFT_620280 [Chaetomium tenue]|uniref:Uncharacterized protein n=1 Tax=Chaetomium tenue TaxID=1854479 RepID=A0ACB7PEI0_9PEZI|nr:hypothetical protein F5144DRAFT_620280 [Chaetomium globosum]